MNINLLFSRIRIPFEATECDCWEWTGHINNSGYGTFSKKMAHRIVFEIFNGKIPAKRQANHTCDCRLCVNPAHIFLGSQSKNMLDCARKGRHGEQLKKLNQKISLSK